MSVELPDTDDEQTPVNTVRVSRSGKQLVVDECVICGETHHHGAQDPTVAKGGRSHRAAHCTGRRGGYYLELDDGTEPPAHWWRAVGVDP